MKATTIFKTIVLSSIMAFAVGCGKDNKSGNGYGWNMQQSNNLSQAGLYAQAEFKQWYESADEYVQPGSYIVQRAKTGYQTGGSALAPGCERREVKIFGTVVGYTIICSGNGGASTSENIRECGVTILASNSNDQRNSSKVNNPILRQIYSGTYGILVDGRVSGSLIELVFQQNNGQMSAYQINKQSHGALQPTIIQNANGYDQYIGNRKANWNETIPGACF